MSSKGRAPRPPLASRSPARGTASSGQGIRPGWAALVLILAGTFVYANGLNAPFVWDDDTSILRNESIRQWGSALTPPPETPVTGRPLPNLSLAVNYALGGVEPFGYHAWNLAVVILAAMLLFGIVRRTLCGAPLAARFGSAATPLALFAALWWLLHPLVTETVDYTTQRTESMMGLFLLLTLYASIRARERGGASVWVALAIAACVAGMASKESMVVAPLVVVLYDLTFGEGAWRDRIAGRAVLYAGLAAAWLPLAAFVASAVRTTAGIGSGVSPATYAMNQLDALWRYAVLTAWPGALVLDYGVPRQLSLGDVAAQAAFVAMLFVALGVALARRSWLAFPFLCVLLALAPTSSILPVASEVAAERRMFVPLAALAPCVAVGVWWLAARAAQVGAWARTAVLTLVCLWLIALAARTVARNAEYTDPLTLWAKSVERHPHGRARLSYAIELLEAGRQDDAITQLREGVVDYPRAKFALGRELAVRGDIDEGLPHLLAFVADNPTRADRIPARRLIGRIYVARNQPDAAIEQFKAILDLSPADSDANASLGDLYASLNRLPEAAAAYRALIGARPSNPEGYLRLGAVLARSERPEEAVGVLEKAAELAPAAPEPRLRIAEILVRLGQPERAAVHAKQALDLAPSDLAHNIMGAALASQGKLPEAIEHFRTALQMAPTNESARNNLTRAERIVASARR
jgi:tetratricopeptide (TPR) repeat protein